MQRWVLATSGSCDVRFLRFQEADMVLKNIPVMLIGAALLGWSGASFADEYQPDEFLHLDLPAAVLSPKPLGPETQFAPVKIEASSDSSAPRAVAQPLAPRKAAAHVSVPKTRVAQTRVVDHTRPRKSREAARTRLVHRHSNPLDAQAMDTRIQVWPCRSGGICNWQQP
jgi:hypothetical protein